jgi:hypothetical protein
MSEFFVLLVIIVMPIGARWCDRDVYAGCIVFFSGENKKTKIAFRSRSTIFRILVVMMMMIHAGHRLTGPNLRLLQMETGVEKG